MELLKRGTRKNIPSTSKCEWTTCLRRGSTGRSGLPIISSHDNWIQCNETAGQGLLQTAYFTVHPLSDHVCCDLAL